MAVSDASARVALMRSALLLLPLLTLKVAAEDVAAVDLVSDIGIARVAEELGDSALLARLGGDQKVHDQLVATRASVHARAPEALIAALAPLACGRHPVLAPEAAFAIFHIAEGMRPSELAARETLKSDLRRARDALECARRAPVPRADIVYLLARASALLLDVHVR